MNSGYTKSPRPQYETSSTSRLSPEMRLSARRSVEAFNRFRRVKSSLVHWCVVLTVLLFEIFTFGSFFGRFLVGELVPYSIIVFFEYTLLFYVIIVTIWVLYQATFGMILPSPQRNADVPTKVSRLAETSPRADTSWVDGHHFGIIAEESSQYFRSSYASPNRSAMNDSVHQMNMSTGGIDDAALPANVVKPRNSPYSKTMDSIHTREQLDYILSKDSSLHMDTASPRDMSFAYFNVLDIGAPVERKGYQLSEQLKTSDSKENIVVKMGPASRIMLSPASTEGDGQDEMTRLRHALQHAKHSPRKKRSDSIERRRRSRSTSTSERPVISPVAGTVSSSSTIDVESYSLRGVDLVRGEQRLRAWLVNTILEPLAIRIKQTNSKLDKEHANPPIKIGASSVEVLQTAMVSRPELLDTMLPYILPFLHVHVNQSYLVNRISELSADKFMMEYNWSSGGSQPVQEKVLSGRIARRPWDEHLPTDAVLVFSLFSAYMDSQLTSNPLVGSCRLAQPFSALYTLKAPERPNPVHLAPNSFYIHMSRTSPPHFDFVVNDEDGSPSRLPIPRGPKNLFSAILLLIDQAKVSNGGKLDRMSIGPTGLNIACVLE